MPKKIVTNLNIEFKPAFIERYKTLLNNDDKAYEKFIERYQNSYFGEEAKDRLELIKLKSFINIEYIS